tara:strand:+ start:16333 stop:17157 length:825 start_codon:yes stop_codon:yes gene_type:complete
MAKADHFFVWRRHRGVPYQHHVIDVGDGTVVHFTDGADSVAGPGGSVENFVVQQTRIEVVTRNGQDRMHVVGHRNKLDDDAIIERALSQVGRKGYHLIFDNCEHFACWCVIDREESRQVAIAHERISAASVKAIAAVTVRTASRLAAKRLSRVASPWMVVADAAQWATEAGGHHVGLVDPKTRKHAGRAVGGITSLGVGALGGPVGVIVAGTAWAAGELAGEASRAVYQIARGPREIINGDQATPDADCLSSREPQIKDPTRVKPLVVGDGNPG